MKKRYPILTDQATLDFLANKQLKTGFSHYDVWLYEHAVSFTVAKMMDADLLSDTRQALVSALKNGQSFAQFKKHLKPLLMKKGWWGEQLMGDPITGETKLVQLGSTRRLGVIFDTNIATAYAHGQWQRIQKNKKTHPFLKYIASTSEQKRQSHIAFYGRILPVDDPFWHTHFPPNGYGCKCSVRALTHAQALRERQEDIAKDTIQSKGLPEKRRFTPEQIDNSIKGRLDDNTAATPLPEVEFVNPRTGQKLIHDAVITPSFAQNAGMRLETLTALYRQKHGEAAAMALIEKREMYLSEKLPLIPAVLMAAYPDFAPKSEIERLLIDGATQKAERSEAIAGAQRQAWNQQRLERAPEGKNQPDFYEQEIDAQLNRQRTVDFMYTMEDLNDYRVEQMNNNFAPTTKLWNNQKTKIQEHLEKADIVPLDLRRLTALNRSLIINYVLSLPEEQRSRIELIVRKSK